MMNPNLNKRKTQKAVGRRSRGALDKSVLTEGVYGNSRLVHAATSLVGCNVQLQVKNGGLYEGIFRTFSPKMEVVLEMAHKVDTLPGAASSLPSKDGLIQSLIFNLSDIVMISASNVDLEYACKETFTDAAITRHNGQVQEKELQPWDAEAAGESLESLEDDAVTTTSIVTTSSAANGWDPNDMFNTNASKFDVKSSYDPNLTQYTTPLVKKDTKEYKEREARAARLANEIERSDEYKTRIDLENGDGDDEEMLFSAVHRAEHNNNTTNGGGKYVPPHMRKHIGGPGNRQVRGPAPATTAATQLQQQPAPPPRSSTAGQYPAHQPARNPASHTPPASVVAPETLPPRTAVSPTGPHTLTATVTVAPSMPTDTQAKPAEVSARIPVSNTAQVVSVAETSKDLSVTAAKMEAPKKKKVPTATLR